MEKINLLIIGDYPYPNESMKGGVQTYTYSIVNALIKEPIIKSITVLCYKAEERSIREVSLGRKLKIIYSPKEKNFALLKGFLKEKNVVKNILKKYEYDLIFGIGLLPLGYIATRFKIPSVVIIHGIMLEEMNLNKQTVWDCVRKILLRRLLGQISNQANAIISISKYSLNYLNKAKCPVYLIPNPLRETFNNFPLEKVKFDKCKRKNLLFLGSIYPLKNIGGIIKAFSQINQYFPESRLQLAGPIKDTQYWQLIQELISELNLEAQVIYLGNLNDRQILKILSGSAALVLFSHQENLPYCIIEAMAAGCPVIASDVGGVNELITHGKNGFLVQENDIKTLSNYMKIILENPTLVEKLGREAFIYSHNNYNPQEIARETIKVFRKTLNIK